MMNQKVLKDKAFAKRLGIACDNHPHAPNGRGRQLWLCNYLAEMTGVKVSPEAVRKWFAGESKPRPNLLKQIAAVLRVDEAWLSLGLTPTVSPNDKLKAKFNALASGAVNLVAAHIQLAGGSVAYPEEGDDRDLLTITRGRQYAISVCYGSTDEVCKLNVPANTTTIIAVFPTLTPTLYRFIRVPTELVEQHGVNLGGFMTVELRRDSDRSYWLGNDRLPEITDFANLDL